MATEITMPKLSDTMTEGRLISWKKSVGEKVSRGDIIAEVETDKANMELEAFTSGVLLETRVKPGEMVQVGTVIAIVGEEGEAAQTPEKVVAAPPPEPEKPQPEPAEHFSAAVDTEKAPQRREEPALAGESEKASPMVRRLAREQGVDLKLVTGSGQDGRILREDLEKFLEEQVKEKVEERTIEPGESQTISSGGAEPLSRMRAAIARTVSRSWLEIPHFAVTMTIDMEGAEEVRRELKESGTPISINDLIVRAATVALSKFPRVNNSFAGDRIAVNTEINIGLAVALEDGLVVPVIKGCRDLSLTEIAARSRELTEKARSGKISEAELAGGTFTISNLGTFGVEEFMAVIFPPQGAILATGSIRDEAVVKNGRVVAGRVMRVTLSADHRLIDGAYAAQFLQELKKALENPIAMLV